MLIFEDYVKFRVNQLYRYNLITVVYANTIEEEVHAKTVEEVRSANVRDKEVHAKTVVVHANI